MNVAQMLLPALVAVAEQQLLEEEEEEEEEEFQYRYDLNVSEDGSESTEEPAGFGREAE